MSYNFQKAARLEAIYNVSIAFWLHPVDSQLHYSKRHESRQLEFDHPTTTTTARHGAFYL